MKAVCWYGIHDMRVETVPDPTIINPHDAIIQVTTTAICGSDLHIYDGYIPAMKKGDIMGHEFMGEVVEVGREVKKLKKGDRVIVPFTICCGQCTYCQKGLYSLCDNTNTDSALLEEAYGYAGSAPLRLFASVWRLCRRAGGVCARAICRRRPIQGSRRNSLTRTLFS